LCEEKKIEKLKLKHLSGLSDGPLSDKKKVNILEWLPRDLFALPTILVDVNASLTEQVKGKILMNVVNV
jgi:hypothetical protein